MSEDNSSGINPAISNHEGDVNSETDARILTQENVNEETISYIAR